MRTILKTRRSVYRYIEDLMSGTYLQQTVENVIGNEAGKQLMVRTCAIVHDETSQEYCIRRRIMPFAFQTEAVYLFGVMLIILDMKYDAAARERMIVSYFRYR